MKAKIILLPIRIIWYRVKIRSKIKPGGIWSASSPRATATRPSRRACLKVECVCDATTGFVFCRKKRGIGLAAIVIVQIVLKFADRSRTYEFLTGKGVSVTIL